MFLGYLADNVEDENNNMYTHRKAYDLNMCTLEEKNVLLCILTHLGEEFNARSKLSF